MYVCHNDLDGSQKEADDDEGGSDPPVHTVISAYACIKWFSV